MVCFSMNSHTIDKAEARKIILHAAGLVKRGQFGKGKDAVYKLIDHLGFVQIDTNYVVERAHHHSIASRVPDYKHEWLDQLQSDNQIFEFWTFAAGYIPMHDFRFSLPLKAAFLARRKPLTHAQANLMSKILDRISREGPLMARDFENDRVTKSSGWWDWRPSKLALEWLHFEGKLITVYRKDFQKVYDLPGNVIPADVDQQVPSTEEYTAYIIRRTLRSLGIATLQEIAFMDRYAKSPVKKEIGKMIESGEVCQVEVRGVKTKELYMLSSYKKKKINIAGDTFILSPFDILNIYRHRLRHFFDFDYQVECFVPKPKRKYGYFSLPILIGDTFVARMDSKADRKQQTLIIHNLHFEKLTVTKEMVNQICDAIRKFASFNQCSTMVLEKCNEKAAAKSIKSKLE
jgi:uncharacterized protein